MLESGVRPLSCSLASNGDAFVNAALRTLRFESILELLASREV